MPAQTIDEVIQSLSSVIDLARREQDQLGYFAALYRRVTIAVKDGIANGAFEDGPRMARLDVCFANRYLTALDSYRRGQRPNVCWLLAFEATRAFRPIILQQLLLGMNAHINLDLGVAAAETVPGTALASLKNDFDRINQILASLVTRVQAEVEQLSPALGWLDRLGGRDEKRIVNFSIDKARQAAWAFANELASAPPEAWNDAIASRDENVAVFGHLIERPGPLLDLGLLWIRLRESGDVRRNIAVLAAS